MQANNFAQATLDAIIAEFLHALAKLSPRIVLDKAKAHFLVHMPFFVRRFGPLLGPDTERYESFNGTFRDCSVLSNRHAPSLDILTNFIEFDRTRHVCSGGWWLEQDTQFVSASWIRRCQRFDTQQIGQKATGCE